MAWDPAQYLKFSDERLRPGFDLLARIGALPPGGLVELGCGTGVHARAIAKRFPDHKLTALDSSPEMLEQAAAQPSAIAWVEADLRSWSPKEKNLALIFSNAVLQWIDDHDALFPRLIRMLAPAGVLAVQMPRNFDAPSHALMRETAQEGKWATRLKPILRGDPVASPAAYYDLLRPLVRTLDIWETEYLHVLAGEDAVLNWVRGTALRPLLDALAPGARADFERAYGEKLRRAYPKRADGKTLLPFRRILIVAQH